MNVTQNPNLQSLSCIWNPITFLDVTQNPNLEELDCSYSLLTNLDISQNPNLVWLACSGIKLTSLDVTQNTNLEELYSYDNLLTNLDLTQNPNLIILSCNKNQLTNLDVSQNPNLKELSCGRTQLRNLDVSQNPNLEILGLSENQLTSLDVSQNMNLVALSCSKNQLTSLNIKNGNNRNMYWLMAYDNPNLNCIMVDEEYYANSQYCNMDQWCKDGHTIYSEDCILSSQDYNQASLSLYPNPTNGTVYISSRIKVRNVTVYNHLGQLIFQEENNNGVELINLSNFPKGLYIVKLMDIASNSDVIKIIVE